MEMKNRGTVYRYESILGRVRSDGYFVKDFIDKGKTFSLETKETEGVTVTDMSTLL